MTEGHKCSPFDTNLLGHFLLQGNAVFFIADASSFLSSYLACICFRGKYKDTIVQLELHFCSLGNMHNYSLRMNKVSKRCV